ncbi:MAG: shikimate kinase [Candidatus Omnitrophica bacterium]|nr:shikimate kinase [Candidatus Omnitrophota bacterium]
MKNVFLIGMMGSGKTTTAEALAKICGLKAVDLDGVIEDEAGTSINEIFAKDGEPAFRELEKKVLEKTAASAHSMVVGTGGGIILARDNVEHMRKNGVVIYLKTSFDVLWNRIKNSKNRPLLKAADPQGRFRSIFEVRAPLYEQAADHVVLTDHKTPREVAVEIYEKFLK